MSQIKCEGFDLPVKTLALGGGVEKILTAAKSPDLAAQADPKDSLRLCLLGRGVREDDHFVMPEIGYDELRGMLEKRPKARFSAKNDVFGYREEHGGFISLAELVNAKYGEGSFDAESMSEGTVITVSSGCRKCSIKADQLLDGRRYYYPLLTSEQILSGMNPADSRGEELSAGFLLTEAGKLLFVLGQRNWNDMNENCFISLAPGGALVSIECLPEERLRHSILYVGPLGGKLGEDVKAYPAGEGVTKVTASAGSLIRFNLDCDDLLNTVHFYYKFTLDDEPCGAPSPSDGFVYNTRIPLYFGSGADYPSGMILPPADMHSKMTVRMLATGPNCRDTQPDCFEIKIV